MDPFRKYIITQIIKQSGKIPRATSLIDNAVAQLKIRLKNAGENISKYTDPKQITQFFNKEKSYWNQQVQQAIKAKDIGTKFSKQKGPFEGFKPTVVKQRGTHRGVGAGEQASAASSKRIKQGFSTQSKLNNWSSNQQWVKDFTGRKNAEFNSLNRADQKEVIEMFEAQIKKHMPKNH